MPHLERDRVRQRTCFLWHPAALIAVTHTRASTLREGAIADFSGKAEMLSSTADVVLPKWPENAAIVAGPLTRPTHTRSRARLRHWAKLVWVKGADRPRPPTTLPR